MAVEDTEYQKEYDKAAAELEAAAQATTARDATGRFAKAEPEKAEPVKEPVKAEPEKTEPVKAEAEPVKTEPEKVEDPLADLRARLEKAEKIAKDNQAWATRLAQERAQEKREREQREREARKPAILDANPELADAIRFVAGDPANQQPDPQQEFFAAVEKAHPGVFDEKSMDPELWNSLLTRIGAMDAEDRKDPLIVIREITEEKLAHGERQIGKRFAAEAAKQAQKSAMSVPGAGKSGVMAPVDTQLAEVQRIQGLSDADFQKEVARAKGLLPR